MARPLPPPAGARSPGRGAPGAAALFLPLLWRAPLLAVPFALFFAVIFGGGERGLFNLKSLWLSYRIALTFALAIMIGMRVAFHWTPLRRYADSEEGNAGALIRTILAYTGVAVSGSFVAAGIIHLWILPGFLGGARAIAIFSMFTLLFAVLFLALSFALQYHRTSLGKVRAEQELDLARRIQESFQVTQFPEIAGLSLHAMNLASLQVSGDIYDCVATGQGEWLLAVGDVTGKGVPAALLSSMLQASLRTQADGDLNPARIITAMNRLAYRSTHTDQFATFFLARLGSDGRTLRYTNAGHNQPIVLRRDGRVEFLDAGGVIVGIMEDFPYTEGVVRLEPGDLLLAYTDGVTEAMDGAGEFYGEERLLELLQGLPADLAAREVNERVLASVRQFVPGADSGDDITLLAVRCHAPA